MTYRQAGKAATRSRELCVRRDCSHVAQPTDTVSHRRNRHFPPHQVIPGGPGGVASSSGAPDAHNGDFGLEVAVEGKTIQCIVGDSSLARLPRALWDSSDGGGRGGGGRAVRIVPVLFTQGIDIQQSMSHASRDAREKAAFQVGVTCWCSL